MCVFQDMIARRPSTSDDGSPRHSRARTLDTRAVVKGSKSWSSAYSCAYFRSLDPGASVPYVHCQVILSGSLPRLQECIQLPVVFLRMMRRTEGAKYPSDTLTLVFRSENLPLIRTGSSRVVPHFPLIESTRSMLLHGKPKDSRSHPLSTSSRLSSDRQPRRSFPFLRRAMLLLFASPSRT